MTAGERLFQVRAAATVKARSPTVDSRVRRTFSDNKEADRRRLRTYQPCTRAHRRDTTVLSREYLSSSSSFFIISVVSTTIPYGG